AADISVRKRRWRDESGRVKPLCCGVRAGTKDGLASYVRANRILSKNGAGVCRVTEYGNRERHSRLILIDRRKVPVLRYQTRPFAATVLRNVVDAAQGKTVSRVAAQSFFQGEVAIVLRYSRLIHRRAEVRSIRQVFRKSVVQKEA